VTLTSERRTHEIVRVLSVILVLNLIVALAKLVYGLRSGAISIQADGVHSLTDASSNVIGLVGVWIASRPPDANHPYGHRKVETFAALGVVMMMMLGCWEIGREAWHRYWHPELARVTPAGFAVLLGTIGVNLFVTWWERREGRRLSSEMLVADAAHTGSDVLASVLVLASFVATRAGIVWADTAAAALVVGLILRAGFEILMGTLSTLGDERRLPPAELERVALEEPGVLEVHNVRTRGALDDIHVDLHVLVDPGLAIADAHAIGHRVERRLRGHWPTCTDVVVHVEPALDSERARERTGGGLRADG
jgi:cation diffusion facilitator family transporter